MCVVLTDNRLRFGERLMVSFHRTLRLPEDGRTYPLPPGFGLLPVLAGPETGEGAPSFLVPLYRREALWIGFSAAPWKPNAVKVVAGGINAVSGLPDDSAGLGDPQNYLVCPDQPWLDGCNIGDGTIRQFVAMPLGQGYGLGAGSEAGEQGGLDIIAYEPLPGHFPEAPPPGPSGPMRLSSFVAEEPRPMEMTLGVGGRMRQKIYPDRFGLSIWDISQASRAHLRLVDARDWHALTGAAAPASPIDAESYTRAGLPWFEIYDEGEGTVAPTAAKPPRTVGERDREYNDGKTAKTNGSVDVNVRQITVIGRDKASQPD